MFIIFMWAFFLHIAVTIVAEVFFFANESAIQILKDTIPVYSTIFAAVIVKGGVENVFKGWGQKTAGNVISENDVQNG